MYAPYSNTQATISKTTHSLCPKTSNSRTKKIRRRRRRTRTNNVVSAPHRNLLHTIERRRRIVGLLLHCCVKNKCHYHHSVRITWLFSEKNTFYKPIKISSNEMAFDFASKIIRLNSFTRSAFVQNFNRKYNNCDIFNHRPMSPMLNRQHIVARFYTRDVGKKHQRIRCDDEKLRSRMMFCSLTTIFLLFSQLFDSVFISNVFSSFSDSYFLDKRNTFNQAKWSHMNWITTSGWTDTNTMMPSESTTKFYPG